MASMAYLLFQHVFPSLMYRVPKEELAGVERVVLNSGAPLATTSSSGRIGEVRFGGPLLRATVYPGGLVIKPIFQASFALTASEIIGVHFKRQWWANAVEITHTSPHVAGRILLHCAEDDPFVTALRTITSEGTGAELR
jgi:hypothetical protein